MKREELLRSREYWLVNIQNDVYNLIENYRNKKKLNKTQLADELGFSKGYISQILNGDFDYKVSKLVDLSLAFNKVPIIKYIDLDKYIEDDKNNRQHCIGNMHIPKTFEYNFYRDNKNYLTETQDISALEHNSGISKFEEFATISNI